MCVYIHVYVYVYIHICVKYFRIHLLFFILADMNILVPLLQGSPTPRLWTGTGPRPDRNGAAQQAVSARRPNEASSATLHFSPPSHYSLTHPPSPLSMEKLSSMKPVPGSKKVGDRCSTVLCHNR